MSKDLVICNVEKILKGDLSSEYVALAELELLTVKELIKYSRDFNINRRYQMKKYELLEILLNELNLLVDGLKIQKKEVDKEIKENPKQHYIKNLEIGQLIAFEIPKGKMIAGKITEIKSEYVRVQTKNGVYWNVRKDEIKWIKTGERWPKGIYQAFKGYNTKEVS